MTSNNETGGNGANEHPAPRILPDLSQTPVASDKPAKAAKAKAKQPGAIAKRGVAAKHAANIKAASDKVRRISRVEPLIPPMCKLFVKAGEKGVHVADLAKALKCSELDVRHAIDKVRGMGVGRSNLQRVAVKTFGLRKGYKLPANFLKAIG